jgi:AbrB family looped-hinge helix DNA binding protein
MAVARVSTRGQVTIPVELRRELQLEPGDALAMEVREGKLYLRPEGADEVSGEGKGAKE